jgi:hypothetical protein
MPAAQNSPAAAGDASSACTFSDPADSPKIITFAGSPPNSAMLLCTHFRGGNQIHQAIISGGALPLCREQGVREEAEQPQTVLHGDDDHAVARNR